LGNPPKERFYGVVGTCKRTGFRYVLHERVRHPEGFYCHVPIAVAAGFPSREAAREACDGALRQVMEAGALPTASNAGKRRRNGAR